MEKQYLDNTLKDFIRENKKGFYEIKTINFIPFNCYLIDGKLYDSHSANINVCKQHKISISKIPKDGVFNIKTPHAFLLKQY